MAPGALVNLDLLADYPYVVDKDKGLDCTCSRLQRAEHIKPALPCAIATRQRVRLAIE